ncbi:MAG: TerC family protein [Bacteroidales bacterium]|nr:TerC family protein [Bacteroidales bacterium]
MTYEIIISLITLVGLEIVLGIDNIIFISILASKLPERQQKKARRYGLLLAMLLRLVLLSVVTLIMQLKDDLFSVFGQGISGKDIVLILGGLFLMYKSTVEIYHKMEGVDGDQTSKLKGTGFLQVMVQILIMDMVFSIDSIITAVGMVKVLWVMYAAIIISVGVMLLAAEPISRFVNNHPAFKMLALSFLLLIGFALVTEGFGLDIPKGYIYFAMTFSFLVDILQMRMNKGRTTPVPTREHYKIKK